MKCSNFQQKSLFKLPKKLVASHVATKGYSITMCCSSCSLLLQKWDASYKLQLVVTQVCKVLRKTNRSLNLDSFTRRSLPPSERYTQSQWKYQSFANWAPYEALQISWTLFLYFANVLLHNRVMWRNVSIQNHARTPQFITESTRLISPASKDVKTRVGSVSVTSCRTAIPILVRTMTPHILQFSGPDIPGKEPVHQLAS